MLEIPIIRLRGLFLALSAATSLQSASALQLEGFVLDSFEWKMTASEFEKAYLPQGFEWISKAKQSARHPGAGYQLREETIDGKKQRVAEATHPKIGSMDVGETIARFEDGTLSRLDISVYNRADNRQLSEAQFDERVDAVKALVSRVTKSDPEERRERSSAVRNKACLWRGKTTRYQLEYSSQRGRDVRGGFQAEFITLKLAPIRADATLLDEVAERDRHVVATRDGLTDNIVRDKKTGDVWLANIPMVDQGDKGYCAVASAERVLRYYGLDVDQHEMAQVAGSGTDGTNPIAMAESLNRIAGRLKVRLYQHEAIEEYVDFERMVKNYNRAAKANGKKEIPVQRGRYLDYRACYRAFDPESLKQSRMKGSGFEKFQSLIRQKIGEGIPVLWSLYLGVYPEKNIPQPVGGHMRLIIGYNERTGQLIYTDSWGAGHEMKRMDMAEGYAMTTGVRTLAPFR